MPSAKPATSETTPEAPRRPRKRPSRVCEAPDLSQPGKVLSEAEVEFFVRNGFVAKKRLLAADAVDDAVERIWQHLLDRVPMDAAAGRGLRRDDPDTWLDPPWAPMPPVPKAGPHAGRQRIVHSGATVKLHDLGAADFLLRLLPNAPQVRRVAEAMLGDLRPSCRTRGVYALFPTSRGASGTDSGDEQARIVKALTPHTDQVCQQLNVCAYLDDVPARCGGFTVYPGSHRVLFGAHRFAANWSPLPTFADAMRQVVAEIEPLELTGDKGDVIFWHGRTVHSAGAHFGRGIRWAVFADYMRDEETLSDQEHMAVGLYEWFKDAKLLRDDEPTSGAQPAPEDDVRHPMWRGWRLAKGEEKPLA